MVSVQYRFTGGTASEISDSIEAGVRSGALIAGTGLPSVRALAAQLSVAPGTVAVAYKALRDRGVVEARGRQGTHVSARPPLLGRSAGTPLPPGVVDLASGQPDPALLPVLSGLPAALRRRPAAAPTEFVLPELVALGRARLAADGVPTEALTVASGGLDAIHRVLSAHLRPGDAVAVEDPGWPNALDLVASLGLRAVPVALDADGPLPPSLERALRAGARAVIVTSRAQNPTGAVLSEKRAGELRRVLAGHPDALLIEDDHAAELAGVPLASLAGATESWAFVRSTSKPYGPDLRVSVIAGDPATIARVAGRMLVGSGWVSTVLQGLTVALWTEPRAAAVVAAAARTYDERRRLLLTSLADRGVQASGETGLNVWVPVADETAVVTSMARSAWGVAPGARFRQVSAPGVRVTVSGLPTAAIPQLADDLADAVSARAAGGYTT